MLGLPTEPLTREDEDALDLDDWELKAGAVARSGAILETESRLVEVWRQRGHPKAAIVTRDVVADHRNSTVDVTLAVEPGPGGAASANRSVTGTERVDPAFARYMTGIRPGEPYDPDTIARARQRLQDLGVFASVSVEEGADGRAGRRASDHLRARGAEAAPDRRRRSYSTIDGATLEGYWMHRNLFGHAESLRFDAAVSRIGADDLEDFSYELATTFRRPGVFTPNTDVTLKLEAEREDVDPYESTTLLRQGRARAPLQPRTLRQRPRSTANWTRSTTPSATTNICSSACPRKLDYDGRDNKLDPTEGFRAILEAEPFADIEAGTLALVSEGIARRLLRHSAQRDRMVLAARGSLGTHRRRRHRGHSGDPPLLPRWRRLDPRLRVPHASAREVNGEVVGGLSFFETSLELRFRVTDTIGIVPFIDAGAAYEDPIPDFSEDVRVGAGVGLRYYTPLGPLRLDVAVPLNRATATAIPSPFTSDWGKLSDDAEPIRQNAPSILARVDRPCARARLRRGARAGRRGKIRLRPLPRKLALDARPKNLARRCRRTSSPGIRRSRGSPSPTATALGSQLEGVEVVWTRSALLRPQARHRRAAGGEGRGAAQAASVGRRRRAAAVSPAPPLEIVIDTIALPQVVARRAGDRRAGGSCRRPARRR